MGYRWPEEDLHMPKRPRKWPWRIAVALMAVLVFAVVLRWPMGL